MIKKSFSTLSSKLKNDGEIIKFYKNIFVSHDSINKYMLATGTLIFGGYYYINQEIKDVKNDIRELKNILIQKK